VATADDLALEAIDLSRTVTASELIYESLRDAIVSGRLAEGRPLRQDTIARMFNVSHIPVREALGRLQAHGLANSARYKGVAVASMSPAEISEIFEFRAVLEAVVVERAVPRMTDADLERAQIACDAFAAGTDPARWGELNRDFHWSLYSVSGMPYHLSVVRNAMDRVERYVRSQLKLTSGMERARADHQAIMDACARGEASTAAELTRRHIVNAGTSLVAFIEQQKTEKAGAATAAGSPVPASRRTA
jgi:DNA-binding GntR family transcriptional regulator